MAHPAKHTRARMGDDGPVEPDWTALDYPAASKEFFAIRKELTDRLGFVNVGWARQIAEQARADAARAAALIIASNTALTFADFGIKSLSEGVGWAVVEQVIQNVGGMDDQVEAALQELSDLVTRIDEIYLPALAQREDKLPIPLDVRPLVYAEPGSTFTRADGSATMFVSPDAVGWIIPLDAFKQIAAVKVQLMRGFFSFAWDAVWEWVAWAQAKIKQGIPWVMPVTLSLGAIAAAIVVTRLIPRRK